LVKEEDDNDRDFQEWYDNRHEYAKNWKERTGEKVVGFILGDASGWEYGVPNTVGWIDTIGVHPGYQKKGIARALLMEMVDRQVPRKPRLVGGVKGHN
jgi:ribosomal protein S18 acetylase RimI-like enzyme